MNPKRGEERTAEPRSETKVSAGEAAPTAAPLMSLQEFMATSGENRTLLAGFRRAALQRKGAMRRTEAQWRAALHQWAAQPAG